MIFDPTISLRELPLRMMRSVRVAVIGAGAMGSLFAAHFAEGGADVWAFDSWREHVDAIRRDGLRVDTGGKTRLVKIRATDNASKLAPVDVALIMVKFGQTASALAAAMPMIDRRTVIVTLQNGIGNVEAIRSLAPNNRILFGLTSLTCEMLGPGRIEASYHGQGETHFWPVDGRADEDCVAIADLLSRGGIYATLAPDIEVQIWKKLVVNCCYNPLCAITGLSVGELVDRPEIWPVLDGITEEIVAAAHHKGIPLQREDARRFLRQVGVEARTHLPSMLIDVRRRRDTEIDCLNGAVVRECERGAIAAPFNRAIVDIVHGIETHWRTQAGQQ